ncbi:hypothetical protein TIFTF001_037765, partial [Ficus carica]
MATLGQPRYWSRLVYALAFCLVATSVVADYKPYIYASPPPPTHVVHRPYLYKSPPPPNHEAYPPYHYKSPPPPKYVRH